MIARTWRGWTRAEDADRYEAYLRETGLAAFAATPGNEGALVLRRIDADRAEFVTISLWATTDSIRAFAGDDIDRAVFYPEDEAFLVDREMRVGHYEVLDPRWPAGPADVAPVAPGDRP